MVSIQGINNNNLVKSVALFSEVQDYLLLVALVTLLLAVDTVYLDIGLRRSHFLNLFHQISNGRGILFFSSQVNVER